MQEFLVAAGGGGDAIAAYMLAAGRDSRRPVIATWAWDRLMIDPLPGPRSIRDFEGLSNPAPDVYIVEPSTRPIPPAGSTLPHLAAELDALLVLLDPTEGCQGLTRQIRAASNWSQATRTTVVDVGGDALGRPHDPGLRSPLADVTTAIATLETDMPSDMVIIGSGCDGELPPDLVHRRLVELRAQAMPPISPEQAQSVTSILEWHPSEATALVVMASLGYRGRVEIRDRGLPVDLAQDAAQLWCIPLGVAAVPDAIRKPIAASSSLPELEKAFQELYGISEIDYERQKAKKLKAPQSTQPALEISEFLASERGTQWVTRRRLREAVGDLPQALSTALLIPTR